MQAGNKLDAFRFPARPDQLQAARQFVRTTLESLGCPAEFVDTTVLAVDEATCNAMRHGYADCDSGDLILEIFRAGDTLTFRLVDFAPPVDPANIKAIEPSAQRPGGLGIYLIQKIMDTMSFETPPEGAGNMLVMTRRLESR
jgi:anti-sigma regulatory factor (Ser/Thr protein kinase)